MTPRCSPRFFAPLAKLLILIPLSSAIQAQATVNGAIGPTSRATVEIKVSVAPNVQVHRSAPVDVAGGQSGHTEQYLCVSATRGVGTYSIRSVDVSDAADGAPGSAEGRFPYQVEWAAPATASGRAAPLTLMPGALVTGLAPASSGGCSSAGQLVVRPAILSGRRPAAGALLLVIAPD